MTLTDEWRTNYDNPKTCALCGKNLESGKIFYVSVRSELKEKLVCKDCLKDRKDDKSSSSLKRPSGWLPDEIDAVETAAELLGQPPERDVFGLKVIRENC